MPSILVPAFLLAALLVSCGDDSSSVSSYEQTSETSSSSVNDDSSSSIGTSGSSAKNDKSSSSVKVKDSSSSRKIEVSSNSSKKGDTSSLMSSSNSSSSTKYKESSSSAKKRESSSSKIPDESSSSVEINSSSSSIKTESSSSSEIVVESSSDVIVEESSSSVQSSSSINSIYDAINNTLTDLRDNQVYKTVTIGEQIWMAENLNYMPEDTAGTIYSGGTVCGGGVQNSKEDSKKCDILGRLYLRKVALNKTTASNRQGICPDGWSIPKKVDWETLEDLLEKDAGKLKISDGSWSNTSTNESGFSLKPTGMYFSQAYGYDRIENAFLFHWSSKSVPYYIGILDGDDEFYYMNGAAEVMVGVRCIKD